MTKTLKGATEKFVNKDFYRNKKSEAEKFYYERDEKGNIIRKVEIVKEGEPKIICPIQKIN